jgi:glyoxylase I family protein
MLFSAIDHPAIGCFDPQKQIDWYCRVLGMKVIASNNSDPPSAIVGYDATSANGAIIELMPAREAGTKPSEMPRFCAGLRHLALRVNSFEKAFAHLKNAGVQFIGEPGIALGGGRIISFRDPEGNELQIVERKS